MINQTEQIVKVMNPNNYISFPGLCAIIFVIGLIILFIYILKEKEA